VTSPGVSAAAGSHGSRTSRTIAVDLLGGDLAPEVVVDGALLALRRRPDVAVTLVGPPETAGPLLAERGHPDRLGVVAARQSVRMDEDPVRAVRSRRDATVRVAARLVRDGAADATVSIGSTGAALAAAVFTLGRLPGVTRPSLALIVDGLDGPLIFLDAGANTDCGADLLGQFALCGSAYATAALGVQRPRVGLLTIGAEPGKGDTLRKDAFAALESLPADRIDFVGNVEAGIVPLGGAVDVVVTDGFSGNLLLKGVEAAVLALGRQVRAELTALGDGGPLLDAFQRAAGRFRPEERGGAILLGVDGVAVVGHGSSSPEAVAACIEMAADASGQGLVPMLREALETLIASRRVRAGLTERFPA
jgi:glycerol-3-phosphate acyltransferase PlsX